MPYVRFSFLTAVFFLSAARAGTDEPGVNNLASISVHSYKNGENFV